MSKMAGKKGKGGPSTGTRNYHGFRSSGGVTVGLKSHKSTPSASTPTCGNFSTVQGRRSVMGGGKAV